ncbi:MAG: tail fiber domain-containing protein [Aureispira sp.]|nr:tail fiber domain-containing protein [Aureispira sp.]
MKNILMLFCAVLFSSSLMAQAPQKLSYQTVIRNASNALVANQAVGVQISVLQGSASGTAVYVETHNPTTNTNGLASFEIGTGTIITGTFASIDWSAGPYFIKTETDPAGGTTYSITGTSELLSVPYALHAQTATSLAGGGGAEWTTSGNDIYNSNTANVGIGTTNPSAKLDVAGVLSITGTGVLNLQKTSSANVIAFNETQNLTFQSISSTFSNPQLRMTIDTDGDVGIGTATPSSRFVVEDLLNGGTIKPAAVIVGHNCGLPCGQPETTQALSLQNENTTAGHAIGIGFADYQADQDPSAWIGAKLVDKTNHYGDLQFSTRSTDGLNARMTIKENGHVGIDNTDPFGMLDIVMPSNSPGYSPRIRTNSGGWYIYSDANVYRAGIFDYSGSSNSYTSIRGDGKSGGAPNIIIRDENIGLRLNNITPEADLHLNGAMLLGDTYVSSNSPWSSTNTQFILGGAHNQGFNAGSTVKLLISGYDNDGATIYPILLEDENGYDDFWIRNRPSAGGSPYLYHGGTAAKPGGGSWTAASDKRLKKQIVPFQEGLAAVLDIRPVKFHYNEVLGVSTEKEYVGVIAQELQDVAPYMVGTFDKDGTEYLDVDNSAMTYMLVNAVKEQQAQIEKLKEEKKAETSKVEDLEKKLEALNAKVEQLHNKK